MNPVTNETNTETETTKESNESQESQVTKQSEESKITKESQESQVTKQSEESEITKESQESQESKKLEEHKEPVKQSKDSQDSKIFKSTLTTLLNSLCNRNKTCKTENLKKDSICYEISKFLINSERKKIEEERIKLKININSVYDIEQINDLVNKKIQYKVHSQIPSLNEKIKKLKEELESVRTQIEKTYLQNEIERIQKEINSLANKKIEYNKSVESIFQYIKEIKETKKCLTKKELQTLYSRFLNIIEFFLPEDIEFEYDKNSTKTKCFYCGCEKFFSDTGIIYCSVCFTEISPEISLYSINKNNTYSSYVYEERENFKKTIERFQGKQKIKFPKDMFQKLDEYFRSYGLPTGEEVRNKKLKLDKELLLRALSEKKFNKYYEDINLISNMYWGYELPDISHIENKLLEDYDKFNEVYRRIKKDRKSSLNTQFLLYKLLKRNGYPCSKSDFKLMKTHDIIEYHEEIYKRVCKELNWR